MEDRQEEHSSANHVEVISWVRSLCALAPAQTKAKKMRGFCAAQDP